MFQKPLRLQISLFPDGTMGPQGDSPYHGDYPNASRTFLFPNQARLVDNSGTVYSTSDLTYNNSLAGSFDDIGFYGELPIVLRGDTVFSYSNTFGETGSHSFAGVRDALFVHGESVFAFYTNGDPALAVDVVDINIPT